MKESVLTVGIAMLIVVGSATFIGCGNEEQHHENGAHHEHTEGEGHHENKEMIGEEHAHYQCPMKCEGEKMYEEEGDCPKCGMDLKELE